MASVNYLRQSFSALFWQNVINVNADLIPVPLGAVSGSLSGFAFENVDGTYTVFLGTDIVVGNVAPISGTVEAIVRRTSLDPLGFDYAVITDLESDAGVPLSATAAYEAYQGGGTELFASVFSGDDHVVIESPASLGPLQQSPLIETYGGDDIIFGSIYDDTIYAGGGDDIVQAGRGADTILGGGGNDHLTGDRGGDTILGQGGDDFISGGNGVDEISGGDGHDEIHGNEDGDTIYGNDGQDVITGDDGDDTIYGGGWHDRLFGGNGNDTIDGGDIADEIEGNAGRDTITGGDGDDFIQGGDGNDTLVGNEGMDTIRGGAGNDRIFGGDGFPFETDIHPARDMLYGGDGNDEIYGEGGDDLIYGGNGSDTIDGGAGFDNAFFDRPLADYQWDIFFDGFSWGVHVIDEVGDGGIDVLTGVERLVFHNGDEVINLF